MPKQRTFTLSPLIAHCAWVRMFPFWIWCCTKDVQGMTEACYYFQLLCIVREHIHCDKVLNYHYNYWNLFHYFSEVPTGVTWPRFPHFKWKCKLLFYREQKLIKWCRNILFLLIMNIQVEKAKKVLPIS